MKDIGDRYDFSQSETYELATRVLITLADDSPVNPRPEDENLAAAYDDVLEDCEGVGG
jgi:hypothetical protein